MNTKISFWLMPSDEYRPFFKDIINQLAQSYNAPQFESHVTIYSGEYSVSLSPEQLIETVIENFSGVILDIEQVGYTPIFTKTLFVQFHPSEILTQMSDVLRRQSVGVSSYFLNPHLSLLYQYLEPATQEKLATDLVIPYSQVFFDEVRAIATPESVSSREDVEKWETLFIRKFYSKS